MSVEGFLYQLGDAVYSVVDKITEFLMPSPVEQPPNFRHLKRLIKKPLSPHEFLSLKLQISFLIYLITGLILLFFRTNPLWILALATVEFLYIRYLTTRNRGFFVDVEPYRFFYYSITWLTFAAFAGYDMVRTIATSVYYYYAYLALVVVLILAFRWYFKQRYGRDYTYGVVEEIKGDAVRVFVHDDIAANVKPGYYWVDAVEDLRVGRVVKLLVEDRKFRGSVPSRIIEVYLEGDESRDQSSQTETEPKEETE
ncbi:hypothetical protein A3L11_03890 [Thermococcus siculi]|uniref:DUF2101 domain-containing protein n=1 Tax=Thermococcus siculi TaxID=72803 RepID=A0A2Z2MKT7_9EURY|nr:DUF2101 family protein [Thermococcus siculi]ASJ08418.1 hypothetical protein A3L11_03890 [Thermococcus siculi]